MRTFHNLALAGATALVFSAGCAPIDADEAVDDSAAESEGADTAKEPTVKSATQELRDDYGFTPHNEIRSYRGRSTGCSINFQHGNIWAVAYAKATVSPPCQAIVRVVALKDGALVAASTPPFFSSDGWQQAGVEWANIVDSQVGIINPLTRTSDTLRFVGVP